MAESVGFIGFGEAGFALAKGLHGAGVPDLYAYDIQAAVRERGTMMVARAAEAGVRLLNSVEHLAAEAEIVFSAVVAGQAVNVAEAISPHLTHRHLFVDLNSTSPATKQAVAAALAPSGARFVEAAVMGAVARSGHRVPMLLAGPAAQDFRTRMLPYGMQLEVLGTEVGSASAVKMFRSIVVKGLEAVLLESLIGAGRWGVDERVLASLSEVVPEVRWEALASYLLGRTAQHAARRGHELQEAAATLEATGIEPLVTAAAARRLLWLAERRIPERFAGRAPATYREVIGAVEEACKR